ncbi:Non-specific serine/threonine protein kinase [Favolaschia claudopus]|uniref:Non-specific serine/threonine protein kinase n=1 Tax=Favolaschia claudopus TaxID=2862362 RepID=A0AAW0C488_9AGAR
MSLQIPSPSRPVSAAVAQPSPSSRRQPPPHRASHQVVSSSSPDQDPQPANPSYTDVYSHPAAVAYAAAHPRRTIPKFGPYLLLQTLGEGEFGKVKLGLHSQWGEEVAVKLIRRGNVDSAVRMSKVEREIEVLRTLKHPNIVRLYDVIETDKYIGIIIEYASGGELFDHILAHRYLREKDASKLFSQLISGVWYIHQKKINLLLDRHRNVIITDFGFANRFEHRADDLMQTSCGSPCYAAPELVISEGLYVGSAVDIWSCAGYLPFDDDPANPDGDNINLLYKYIVNTPLSFPEYISEEARSLLKMMLVPDPRRRASLQDVMRHPWLAAYHTARDEDADDVPTAFGKTVEELERAAMDQHQMKRLAYQRQMRATPPTASPPARAQTQSHAQAQNQLPPPRSVAPETLYDSSAGPYGDEEDPFGPAPGAARRAVPEEGVAVAERPSSKGKEKEKEPKDFRHTIQVEYDDRRGQRDRGASESPVRERKERERSKTPTQTQTQAPLRTPTQSPAGAVPPSSVATPKSTTPAAPVVNGTDRTGTRSPSAASITERRESRRRGASTSSVVPTQLVSRCLPVQRARRLHGSRQNTLLVLERWSPSMAASDPLLWMCLQRGNRDTKQKEKDGKKTRRNTLTGLTVMVNNSIRNRNRTREPSTTTNTSPPASLIPSSVPAPPHTGGPDKSFDDGSGAGAMKASTSKARKVMHLTVGGSAGTSAVPSPAESTVESAEAGSPVQVYVTTPSSGPALSPIVTKTLAGGRKASESASPSSATPVATTPSVSESLASRFRRSVNIGAGGSGGTIKGRDATAPGTITTGQPPEVMRHVKEVLMGMGLEIQVESEYKYRCIRAKQRRGSKSTTPGAQGGVAAFTMVGSAASNGVDKRGLPIPSQSSFSGGGMLRGLLMRRQSSQVSTAGAGSTSFDGDDSLNASGILTAEPQTETVYGVSPDDAGDEVRFSVELTRLDRLNDTYSLDIRRLKGNLRSYKFLYDTLRQRADLQR